MELLPSPGLWYAQENDAGATPLHCACSTFDLDDDKDAVFLERLIDRTPEKAASQGNTAGWTALHHLVQKHAAKGLCFDDDDDVKKHERVMRCVEKLIAKAPSSVSATTSAGDTPLHLVTHANRKRIGAHAAKVMDALVTAAPEVAVTGARGKADKAPIDWLPPGDPRFCECDEILTNRAARCLEILLENYAAGAQHAIPGTGDMALHQLCAIVPPILTRRMLTAMLEVYPRAAATARQSDGKTPLHLLCRAIALSSSSSESRTPSSRDLAMPGLIAQLLQAAPSAAAMKDYIHHRTPREELLYHSSEDGGLIPACLAVVPVV